MQKIKRGNACATEVKAWGEEKDSRRSSSNSSISSQKRRRRRRRTKPSLSLDGKSIDRFFCRLASNSMEKKKSGERCSVSSPKLSSPLLELGWPQIEFALGGYCYDEASDHHS